jgi:polysaccharide biosynthesis transport protein
MKDDNLPVVSLNNASELHVAADVNPMPESPQFLDSEEQPTNSGMSVRDVFFTLLRHKWKIIFFGFCGLAAAAVIYFGVPPVYESEAKLLVRYVVDRSAVDGLDPQIKTPTPENHALINSEVEILLSSDLISQVAQSVGIEKLTAAAGEHPTLEKAVDYIYHNLGVSVVKETNIISVTFDSSDRDLPALVVQELVKRYFDKHLEVHRSTGAFDIVSKETANLKKELAATDDELKKLKDSAGIISLTEAKTSLATEVGKTQQELDLAEADLAAQKARVQDLLKSANLPSNSEKTTGQPVSADIVQRYQSLGNQLSELQKAETELLSKYTPQNPLVRTKTAQIQDLERQRNDLEKQYPGLLDAVPVTTSGDTGQTSRPNLAAEKAILAGMASKVDALKLRMSNLETRTKTISDVAPQIEELERKAEVEETNYKHSEASLEKAQVDETLDPSRMPNISIVQNPATPTKVKRNLGKTILGIAGGGFGVGIALAFLIELILDTTIKRPLEVEKRLRLPLLITIPYLTLSGRQLRLRDKNGNSEVAERGDGAESFATDASGALFRPFCEAIRDRLGVFFEVNNMAYKPKLVAVTGLSKNAGASTIAAGLADAFSEFSEGKVLLVDKFVSSKGFYNQLTEFKRSDLDYVIFDMPCLGDTSSTLPLAGFMDTVLLVIEAEKSNRDVVKRAYAQLSARTKVSVVFNKSRSYGPKWLEGEL